MKKNKFIIILIYIMCFTVVTSGCSILEKEENERCEESTEENEEMDTKETYRISVEVDTFSKRRGNAYGDGEYEENEYAWISAVPNEGYYFKEWDDGNTEQSRKVLVTGHKTYYALFDYAVNNKEPYYSLDKVEVYAEMMDSEKPANHVELNEMIITKGEYVISELKLGENFSMPLIKTESRTRIPSREVVCSASAPISFYSTRSYNNYNAGATVSLEINYAYDANSKYIYDDQIYYDNNYPSYASYGSYKSVSFTITEETTKTILLEEDTLRGFRIYVKLNFVERYNY